MNLPPLYVAPIVEDAAALRGLVLDYNDRMILMRENLQLWHQDTTIFIFDVHAYLAEVMRDPTQFTQTAGLKNTSVNCWDYNP